MEKVALRKLTMIQLVKKVFNQGHASSALQKVKQSRYRPGMAQRVPGS